MIFPHSVEFWAWAEWALRPLVKRRQKVVERIRGSHSLRVERISLRANGRHVVYTTESRW